MLIFGLGQLDYYEVMALGFFLFKKKKHLGFYMHPFHHSYIYLSDFFSDSLLNSGMFKEEIKILHHFNTKLCYSHHSKNLQILQ